eukprot:182455-Rhodomonas_salina.1
MQAVCKAADDHFNGRVTTSPKQYVACELGLFAPDGTINEDVKECVHEMMRAKCVCGPTGVPGKFYVAFRRVDSSGA